MRLQRVVIDTNVLVSALRSRRGASFRLISLLGDPRWQPIVSVALILEYEEVTKREADRLGLAEWAIESILDMFCRLGSQHAVRFRLRPAVRDPDDEFLVELAAASQADFLVTYNIHDFRGSEAYGIRPVTPGEFLRTIGAWP
jgi:putative PIN family toxin of toxin-antitoxin system